MDVLFADGDVSDARAAQDRPRAVPEPAAVARAAALLDAAERPVLIGGGAIWWDGAWDELRALAEGACLPVFLNGSGRGALPPDHELFFQHARSAAVQAADVVCVVGTPLDFRLGYGRFPDAKLIHVHSDERELGRNRIPDVAVAGDSAAALGGMASLASPRQRSDWFNALRIAEQAWWDTHRAEIESESAPIHHYRLGAELDRVIGDEVVVIGDGGDVVAAVSRVLRVPRAGHWLDPGPFGCLGVGLPYALGVAAAWPDARILVVAGDGALGLNGFELDTLARFGVRRSSSWATTARGARSASRRSGSTATRARSRHASNRQGTSC
jgi:acetolactate synthase-1/2/3 large subunit